MRSSEADIFSSNWGFFLSHASWTENLNQWNIDIFMEGPLLVTYGSYRRQEELSWLVLDLWISLLYRIKNKYLDSRIKLIECSS
jgi:hypothetical protein